MTNIRIEDLDLSKLSGSEEKALTAMIQKGPRTWKLGLFLGVALCFTVLISMYQGDAHLTGQVVVVALVKAAGFVGLSLWARSWLITPSILLLLWHLWTNARLFQSNLLASNLIYFGVAIVFAFGIFGCWARRKLLAKAQKTPVPPLEQVEKAQKADPPPEQDDQVQKDEQRRDDLY